MTHLIYGVEGQVGQYLVEIMNQKNEFFIGVGRNFYIVNGQQKIFFNGEKFYKVEELIKEFQINSIYYLAASHIDSEKRNIKNEKLNEQIIMNTNYYHYEKLLEILKINKIFATVFYTSSSLIFEGSFSRIQNELTNYESKTIYGKSKILSMELSRKFSSEKIRIVNAICYNHESSKRKENFLSQKIVSHSLKCKKYNLEQKFEFLKPHIQVDWSHAYDLARALYFLNSVSHKGNIIISSGEPHTPIDFIEKSFEILGMRYERDKFDNEKLNKNLSDGRLLGDNSLLMSLGFRHKMNFHDMVQEIVQAKLIRLEKYEQKSSFKYY